MAILNGGKIRRERLLGKTVDDHDSIDAEVPCAMLNNVRVQGNFY